MKKEVVAKLAHEVNRIYSKAIGDFIKLPWEDSPEWVKISILNGIDKVIENPDILPEDIHKQWMKHKQENGWKFGNTIDEELKTHPCLVEYDLLPIEQRSKDEFFNTIVKNLMDYIDEE